MRSCGHDVGLGCRRLAGVTDPGCTGGRWLGGGAALVFAEALSLWGGVDPETGMIVDRHHPQHGVSISGAVVFMPHGRGSSSASSVLVEMVRLGIPPAAFVLERRDEMLAIGALVAEELYGHVVPIVIREPDGGVGAAVRSGDSVELDGSTLAVRTG